MIANYRKKKIYKEKSKRRGKENYANFLINKHDYNHHYHHFVTLNQTCGMFLYLNFCF